MPTDLRLTIKIVNVEHEPIQDSTANLTITRQDKPQVRSRADIDFSRGPVTVSVPGAEAGVYHLRLRAAGYQDREQVVVTDGRQPLALTLTLTRQPDRWRAVFTPWADLPASFDGLRSILERSQRILLVDTGEVVQLTEEGYDALVSDVAAAAKAAMLNIYYELSVTYEPVDGTRSFLSFVRSVEALGRNRLLAVVEPGLGDILTAIADHPDRFHDWNSLGVDMPRFYLPPHWRMRIADTRHLRLASNEHTLDVTVDSLRQSDTALATFAIVQSAVPVSHHLPFQRFNRILEDAHAFEVYDWLFWAASGPRPVLGYRLEPRQ